MKERQRAIEQAKVLKALIELNQIKKLLDTFIPAFKTKTIDKNDLTFLHGNFNLGGTVSGRMSSSKPNLQNIPSTGSKYAKTIKQCFVSTNDKIIINQDKINDIISSYK